MTKHLPTSKAGRLTVQSLLAASVVGLGIAGIATQLDSGNPAEAQVEVAQPPAPEESGLPLDTYSRVERVRREAGLGNQDLAALGLSRTDTEAVMARLVEWCEANKAGITRAKAAVTTAKRELREQQRLVRIGEASERQLTDAGGKAKAVVDAEQAYTDLMKAGALHALQAPEIAPGTSTTWQRASGLKGMAKTELRYAEGMDADRLAYLETEAERQKAELSEVMSYKEKQACQAVRDRMKASMPGVLLAESLALPLPPELRDELLLLELVTDEEP